MLILTRTEGKRILVGDDITITVTKIKGNQVCIGIDAPDNVSIDREEVRNRKNKDDKNMWNNFFKKCHKIKPGRPR